MVRALGANIAENFRRSDRLAAAGKLDCDGRKLAPHQRVVLEIASLEKGIAKARAEAVEAARARRTLEILRDQRLAAFADGERRKEQGALDELGQQRAHAPSPNTHDGAVA